MLLRASGEAQGAIYHPSGIMGTGSGGSGVAHGEELTHLVDTTLGSDDHALVEARTVVVETVGEEGLIDAAAIIATFSMQTRVADATGIPLDVPMELASRGLRGELGVERFSAAACTPRGGWARRALSRIMEPLAPTVLSLAAKLRRR